MRHDDISTGRVYLRKAHSRLPQATGSHKTRMANITPHQVHRSAEEIIDKTRHLLPSHDRSTYFLPYHPFTLQDNPYLFPLRAATSPTPSHQPTWLRGSRSLSFREREHSLGRLAPIVTRAPGRRSRYFSFLLLSSLMRQPNDEDKVITFIP
jgi:hypothetical protein